MENEKQWLLYGATGETGRMIVTEAVRRGQRPKLAGRSAGKVRALAEPLGLQWTAFGLDDLQSLRQATRDASMVLLAAGPFEVTSAPVVQACLDAGVPYADIANEIGVFEAVHTQDQPARQRGVALVSGVGFGVSTSDALAKYVVEQAPDATELEIAIAPYTGHTSVGAAQTSLQAIASGGRVRRDGQLIPATLGAGGRYMAFPDGIHTILPAPLGDLVSSYYATGIQNITVYLTFGISPRIARLALPVAQRLMAMPALRQRLTRTGNKAAPKVQLHDAGKHSYVWARARNAQGVSAEAWLETGEGYAYTAAAADRAVEEILERHPVGALTPAQVFGADFPLRIKGVRRFDRLSQQAGIMPVAHRI
ncbi:MAG: saccharopine dehydrogenase NADP-binding domain-containing protein [Chloroflexi bacterium]|nr:saccharopine dehydrogenase NADP-binding domain-containing protein [Chloroflexota bacterium]MCL5275894.1 saccharopine dehydrogenase NADP-binding domain-containing protein [Chloroflexota bacterium]